MKKGIKQSKVQRMRNLVSKNFGSKTEIRSGYLKRNVEYREGDVWEERGKTWTIKNGVKRTVNKTTLGRKIIKVPYKCPKCSISLSHRGHKKMFKRWGMCLACVTKWMQEMKSNNTYDDFIKHYKEKNFDVAMQDVISEYNDWLNSRNSKHYITEAGDIEDWSGGKTNEQLKKEFNKTLNKIKKDFEEAHEDNIETNN
mgnify:CR=1 FL=1